MLYASYLFFSVTVGAWRLYQRDKRQRIRNELKHDYYVPVSVLVPACNEEVTIADSVKSLLNLKYRLFEIIVVDDGSRDLSLIHISFQSTHESSGSQLIGANSPGDICIIALFYTVVK